MRLLRTCLTLVFAILAMLWCALRQGEAMPAAPVQVGASGLAPPPGLSHEVEELGNANAAPSITDRGQKSSIDPEPEGAVAAARVEPGGIEFLVVDALGAAMAASIVTAFAGERDLATARTDAAGRAVLHGVEPPVQWRVRALGAWPVAGICDGMSVTRVVMPLAPRLDGRVFDTGGVPVAAARVLLLPVVAGRLVAPPELPELTPQASTDAQGRFEIAWPDADARDLVASARGFATTVVAAVRAEAGAGAQLLTLVRGAVVRGDAMRQDGSPLGGARVEVWSQTLDAHSGVRRLGPMHTRPGGQLIASATTANDGTFVLADLPMGAHVVVLAAEHGSASQCVQVAPGVTSEVRLVAAPSAQLRGRVAPAAPDAVAFLYGGPCLLRSIATAPDGSFVFAQVPAGRYLVGAALVPVAEAVHAVVQQYLVTGEASGALLVELTAGEGRDVVLAGVVASNGIVCGFASIAGQAAADCVVAIESVLGVGANRREGTVAADGAFRIESVPAGDYYARLRRRGENRVLQEAPCRVRAGDTQQVTLARP